MFNSCTDRDRAAHGVRIHHVVTAGQPAASPRVSDQASGARRRSGVHAPPATRGTASLPQALPALAVAPRTRQAASRAGLLFANALHTPQAVAMKENGPSALFEPACFGAMLRQCFAAMGPGDCRLLVLLTGTHSVGLELRIDAGEGAPDAPHAYVVTPWSLEAGPVAYPACRVATREGIQELRMANVFGPDSAADMTGGIDEPLGRVYAWPPLQGDGCTLRSPMALHLSPERIGTPAFLYAAMDAGWPELVRQSLRALAESRRGPSQEPLEAALTARRAGHCGPPALSAAARTQARVRPQVLEAFAQELMAIPPHVLGSEGKLRVLTARTNGKTVLQQLAEAGLEDAANALVRPVLQARQHPLAAQDLVEFLETGLRHAKTERRAWAPDVGGCTAELARVANGAAALGDRVRLSPVARAASH